MLMFPNTGVPLREAAFGNVASVADGGATVALPWTMFTLLKEPPLTAAIRLVPLPCVMDRLPNSGVCCDGFEQSTRGRRGRNQYWQKAALLSAIVFSLPAPPSR